MNRRVRDLAQQQSADITRALASAGVKIIHGTGKLLDLIDLSGNLPDRYLASRISGDVRPVAQRTQDT